MYYYVSTEKRTCSQTNHCCVSPRTGGSLGCAPGWDAGGREVVSSRLRADQHSGSLSNWGEKCCLCNFICIWLDFLVVSDNFVKPEVPSHKSLSVDNSVAPTHCSPKSRVIPVSFVCEWGEVGHLVRDLEVLLSPFPLGNKSCPVKSKLIMSITMSINYLSLG